VPIMSWNRAPAVQGPLLKVCFLTDCLVTFYDKSVLNSSLVSAESRLIMQMQLTERRKQSLRAVDSCHDDGFL
jgi:hypothetical protein